MLTSCLSAVQKRLAAVKSVQTGPCVFRMIRKIVQYWVMFRLIHSPVLAIYRIDGSLLGLAVRQSPAIAVPITCLTWFICSIQWVLALFLPHILCLRASTFAGQGSYSTAYRGSYFGVPFIVKLPRVPGAMTKEWDLLRRRLPVDPGVTSRLPIPHYFGLFRIDGEDIMVTSDDGVPIAQLDDNKHDDLRCVLLPVLSVFSTDALYHHDCQAGHREYSKFPESGRCQSYWCPQQELPLEWVAGYDDRFC